MPAGAQNLPKATVKFQQAPAPAAPAAAPKVTTAPEPAAGEAPDPLALPLGLAAVAAALFAAITTFLAYTA